MLLSVVDVLRCPMPHEETPLVLSVEAWKDQRVDRGTLGCPVCHARFRINDGITDFRGDDALARKTVAAVPTDPVRLAAQLGLSDPGGLVLLSGPYAGAAGPLTDAADVTCLVVDAPDESGVAIEVTMRLPIASGALRGAAVHPARSTSGFLAEAARVVKSGGRLVAPASSEAPARTRIFARDDREWVAEVVDSLSTVPLVRGGTARI